MGVISALVVSPCVTPILAGALLYVAGTGDAATGAASLFALALGMGCLLYTSPSPRDRTRSRMPSSA